MSRFYNKLTQEILDYPEDAAALFDVLVRVPSERDEFEDSNVVVKPPVADKADKKDNSNAN